MVASAATATGYVVVGTTIFACGAVAGVVAQLTWGEDGEIHIQNILVLQPPEPDVLSFPADLLDGTREDESELPEQAPGGRCRMPFCDNAATYGFCHADTAIVHGSCKEHTVACLDRGTCPYCNTGYQNIVKIITG